METKQVATYKPVIIVSQDTKRVLWCSATGSLPVLVPQAVIIGGQRAEMLYTSISGHGMSEHPTLASPIRARAARAGLMIRRDKDDPESILINEVIAQWGEYIRPWFGCYVIDTSTGNRFLDLEIYNMIYDLSTDRVGLAVDMEVVNGESKD